MAGTVATQSVTRVAIADGGTDTGTWTATGGGAGLNTADTELFVQGTTAVSIQVSNKTDFSVNYTHSSTIDLSNEVIMGKVVNSTFGNISGNGLRLRYGNDASNYYQITIATSAATYQTFSQGVNKFSWWFVPVQPALGYSSTIGSPSMSTWDYVSAVLTNNSTARTNNLALDAVDYCDDSTGGLNVTGGTGGSEATYDDFAAYDDDTVGNKYGFCLRQVGGLACAGTLQVGTSGTSVLFLSESESLTWIDAAVPAGFMRCVYDLQNASTDIDIDKLVAKSEGNTTTTDTRMDVTFVGTSGTCDITNSSWTNVRNFTLTSKPNLTDCTIECADLTHAGADIDGGTIITTSAANVATCDDATFGTTSGIRGVNFVQGNAGHAIEITSTGTYDLQDITWTDYSGTPGTNLSPSTGSSAAAIYNNSGGAVTINVNGTGTQPSIRNAASSTTTVNVSVTMEVNGVTEGTRVSVIGNGGAEDGNTLLQGYADSTGKVTGSFGGTTPQNVIVRARNSGIVAAVIQDDASVFTDYTDEAREQVGADDVVYLPASPATNDACYIAGLAQFGQIVTDVDTAGATYVGTWEYWNGAWTSLTVTDNTNGFQSTGWNTITFDIPSDWTTTTINSQGPFYYVRYRVTTGGGTGPSGQHVTLKRTTKYLPFNGSGTIATGTGLTSTAVWIEDTIAG